MQGNNLKNEIQESLKSNPYAPFLFSPLIMAVFWFPWIALKSNSIDTFIYFWLGILGIPFSIITTFIAYNRKKRLGEAGQLVYGVPEYVGEEIQNGHIQVRIRYHVGDKSYTDVSLFKASLAMSLTSNTKIPILYDPADPTKIVIKTDYIEGNNPIREPDIANTIPTTTIANPNRFILMTPEFGMNLSTHLKYATFQSLANTPLDWTNFPKTNTLSRVT